MTFSLGRRRRRRRRGVVVAVVIGIILVLGFAVTRAQSDRQATREYLDFAMTSANDVRAAADGFVDAVVRLDQTSRPALLEVLDVAESELARVSGEVAAVEAPSGRLGEVHSLLRLSTETWAEGMVTTRAALLVLTETPLDEPALAQLEAGLLDLRLGDAAYSDFEALVNELGESSQTATMPSVAFVPAEHEDLYQASSLARRLLLSPSLEPRNNLAVADIKVEPNPVGDQEGIPVVPVSDQLDVEVTVANRGNVDASLVAVTFSLVSNDGDLVEETRIVEGLEPGALTTLAFVDLPVRPGGVYEITVSLGGEDEDASDDTLSFVFIRNAEE